MGHPKSQEEVGWLQFGLTNQEDRVAQVIRCTLALRSAKVENLPLVCTLISVE